MSSPEDAVPEIRMSIYGAEISEDDFVEDTALVQGKAEKKVLDAIVALNAYCTLAYDIAKDFKDTHASATDTSMVNFIIAYGAPENAKKNIVTAYSDAMGALKGKFDDGIGLYLLEHMHKSILAGTSLVADATVGSLKRTLMNHEALGLQKRPKYFEKLSVSRSLFINANLKLEAANANADAQAAAAWLKKGAKDTFRSFRQQAEQVEKNKVTKYKEEQFEEALNAIKNNFEEHGTLSGLPRAGGSGANKVAPIQTISDEEIEANAKQQADEWIKANADRDTIDEEANDANDEVISEDNKEEAEKMIDAQPAVMFSSMRFTATKMRNDAKQKYRSPISQIQFQYKGKAVSVKDCTITKKDSILIHCNKPRNVDKWTWVTTQNYGAEHDPVSWKAEVQFAGSADWTTVTEEDDYAVTTKRNTNCCGDKWFDIAQPEQQLTCDAAAPSAIKCFGEGSCFALVDTKSSHDTASCQCKRLGGSLGCFTSQEEENAVVNWWKSSSDVDSWDAKMWFGLNDQIEEGTWTCGGGSPAYSHWRDGEPNDMGGEDCAEISKYGGYKWEDMKCSKALPFVCSVPKPDDYVAPLAKIVEEATPAPTTPPVLVGATSKKTSGCNAIKGKYDQYLDRQGLDCGKGMVMQSFKMTQSGCSGNKQQYEYTCGPASIESTDTVFSGCQAIKDKKLQYLDRQDVSCGAGKAVAGFKLTKDGCSGKNQQYKVKCATLSRATTTTTKKTSCTPMDGEKLQFLDRQSVKCPNEEALSEFQVVRTGCSGKNMRYKYTCSAAEQGLKEDQEVVQLFDKSFADKFKNYGADDVVVEEEY